MTTSKWILRPCGPLMKTNFNFAKNSYRSLKIMLIYPMVTYLEKLMSKHRKSFCIHSSIWQWRPSFYEESGFTDYTVDFFWFSTSIHFFIRKLNVKIFCEIVTIVLQINFSTRKGKFKKFMSRFLWIKFVRATVFKR